MHTSVHRPAAATLVAVALTAAAPADAGPHVVDPCGDAGRMLEVAEEPLADVPDGERVAGFDVESASFTYLPDEATVRVTLDLCGDVPGVELPGSAWGVRWRVSDTCVGVALEDVQDGATPGVQRVAAFWSGCDGGPADVPLPVVGSGSAPGFWHEITDDGATVAGDRITWTLREDAFTGDAAEVLRPGTVWVDPAVWTRDGRRGVHVWGRDGTGKDTHHVSGPGAADEARSDGGTFVLTRDG